MDDCRNEVTHARYCPITICLASENSLDLLLASVSKESKICYVVGDWNLDLIKHHCHESTGEFLEIMYVFSVDHTSNKVNF